MSQPLTSSSVFAAPVPLANPFRTIDELLRSYASEPRDMPLVEYPASGVTDFEGHTAKDLDKYADAAIARFIDLGMEPADPTSAKAPVVAVLAPSSFETVVAIFALNRLGWSLMFLSTRLAAPAYVRLLKMADCSTIITTPSYDTVIEEIQAVKTIRSVPFLTRTHYRDIAAPRFQRNCNFEDEAHKTAWIIHSSGSTGFPKPIFLSNLQVLANFAKTLCKRTFCTSPLFHSHALFELGRSIFAKKAILLPNYSYPVTRQNLVAAMEVARPEMLSCVPYVLKLLAESEEGLEMLKKPDLVLFAGSGCPEDLGNRLVERGIKLIANYGATETGQIFTSFRPLEDKEWIYMRLRSPVADHVLMDEISPGIFECVALDGLPSKNTINSDNPPNSFRTRDLFTRHPDPKKSSFYKYLSRLDDRITLVNGEKVLPLEFEGRIRQHELVQEAVIFGVGRTFPGLLVFRSERASELNDGEFLTKIWPAIEAANARAESFARIPKELVFVLPANTKYPKTDKGTFIRQQLYREFATFIDKVYRSFEDGEVGTIQLNVPELEAFLLAKFREDLGVQIASVESDIFSAGVDSLQTMRMWSIIKKKLDLGGRGDELSQNVVFEKGNVRSLAKHLYYLRTSEGREEVDEIQIMSDLIAKYSDFNKHSPKVVEAPKQNSVLLTGATGSLGSHLLAKLLKQDGISKVWTLVRASDEETAYQRIQTSLNNIGTFPSELEKQKIIALPCDFNRADLGLAAANLDHLKSTVTHVIDSAWAVNFNLGVQSFEAQHIRGVYNLLNICLSVQQPSPAKFFFCSSVSVAAGTPKPASIKEAVIEDLLYSQKTGYGRSKMIGEHITRNAMRLTSMHARVLRIGQLAGDSAKGIWNETEAVALMIRSAITTGALPALDEKISWLPVDMCASAILDIVLPPPTTKNSLPDSQDPNIVYHLLNPITFHWKRDLLPALCSSSLPAFEIMPVGEWLQRLKNSNPDPVKNPSKKLYGFWEEKYATGDKAPSGNGEKELEQDSVKEIDEDIEGLKFEVGRTLEVCEGLRRAPDLIKEGYIEKFVKEWMKKWEDGGK